MILLMHKLSKTCPFAPFSISLPPSQGSSTLPDDSLSFCDADLEEVKLKLKLKNKRGVSWDWRGIV